MRLDKAYFKYISYCDKGRVYSLELWGFYHIIGGYLKDEHNKVIRSQNWGLAANMRDVVYIHPN